jgi:hypothetical protein
MSAVIAVSRRVTLERYGFSWHGHQSFKAAYMDFESWAQRPCLVDRLLNKEAR